MAITLTGTKYSGNVVGLSDKTLTVSGVSMATADFNTTRILALYDSANAFKGIAYVNRALSATELLLESPFFDPVDYALVPIAAGDQFDASLTFAELATTGLSVSGHQVEITDNPIYGVNGDPRSLCLYDEDKDVTTTNGGQHLGGVVCFGHLLSLETKDRYAPVSLFFTANSNVFRTTSSAANFFMFGGSMRGSSSPMFFGAYQGSSPNSMVIDGVESNGMDLLSPGAGGSWGATADRCVLRGISATTKSGGGIMVRWGDGKILGGSYRFQASGSFGVFGTDTAGAYEIAALAGERLVVEECGRNGTQFVRTYGAAGGVNTTFDLINVVTPVRTVGPSAGSYNANNKLTFKFKDAYKNAVVGTKIVIRDSALATVAAGTANGSDDVELEVTEATVNGDAETIVESAWTWGAFVYGKGIVSGSFATTSREVIAGTAKDVRHGATLIQSDDLSITEPSAATALAYTQTNSAAQIYDHLAAILERDFAGEQALYVSRAGTTADFGSYDVVIDGGTGEAQISGNTITIFEGGAGGSDEIVTTGTISFANGGQWGGGLIDSASDSYLRFQSVSSWSAYATEADAIGGTSPLDTGTVNDTFRFNFSGGLAYYLALYTATGARIVQVTPTLVSGENLISLDTQSILNEVLNQTKPQAQRDAMALDLSVGITPAPGSVDAHLDDIDEDTLSLTENGVNVASVGGTAVAGPDDLKGDGMTEASLHAALDTYANKGDWKDGFTAAQIATEV